jgi:NADH-quinone oxidoreductase subunit D
MKENNHTIANIIAKEQDYPFDDPIKPTFTLPPTVLEDGEMYVNMGPQHPSTHGVLRLIIKTDGEIVKEVIPVIGYLHRCAEKIGENLTYPQFVPYTDRMDYLTSMSNNLGFCLAVEKLLGVEVPLRAQFLRIIFAELNRIASHLLAIGTYGIDIGAVTPFLYCFREREMILSMFEIASGARLTYNYIRIGGVMREPPKEFYQLLEKFIKIFPQRIDEYNELLTYNQVFINRTKGIGILPPKIAIMYGVTGPNARASGIPIDIRKAEPYSSYDKIKFNVPVGKNGPGILGDCWNRYFVRVEEMRESLNIIKQALEGLPDGDFISPQIKRVIRPPKGEVYFRMENPRGELGFYVISDGTEKPYRVKVRAPSFCNLSVFPEISRNVLVADLIAILGSIDIVLGEVDR